MGRKHNQHLLDMLDRLALLPKRQHHPFRLVLANPDRSPQDRQC